MFAESFPLKMSKRRLFIPKGPNYPADEWNVIETSYHPDTQEKNESVFAVANGYIGLRASFEEKYKGPGKSSPGVYLNGYAK